MAGLSSQLASAHPGSECVEGLASCPSYWLRSHRTDPLKPVRPRSRAKNWYLWQMPSRRGDKED